MGLLRTLVSALVWEAANRVAHAEYDLMSRTKAARDQLRQVAELQETVAQLQAELDKFLPEATLERAVEGAHATWDAHRRSPLSELGEWCTKSCHYCERRQNCAPWVQFDSAQTRLRARKNAERLLDHSALELTRATRRLLGRA